MLHSSKMGIVGVGEGSTEHFHYFMQVLGIGSKDLIRNADATLKAGIMFEGWTTGSPYLHSIAPPYNQTIDGHCAAYAALISQRESMLHASFLPDSKIPVWLTDRPEDVPAHQFHFNTFKLNEYLNRLALERGIRVTDDRVLEVESCPEVGITKVISENHQFEGYDLYVDATGMSRLLSTSLGTEWESFSQYLLLDSAIVFGTGDSDNYNLWTKSRALTSGWMFTIPTWGRHGNGYIFSSRHISQDAAVQELRDVTGLEVSVGKTFSFDPGYLREVWKKNTVSVGLAGSFVEPLEATSIGTTIMQTLLLVRYLASERSGGQLAFNQEFAEIMEDVRDFVALHYRSDRDDTPFWRDCAEAPIPASLAERLSAWEHRLPRPEDFSGRTEYCLFDHQNYTVVLHGMGLTDPAVARREFEMIQPAQRQKVLQTLKRQRAFEATPDTVSHKDLIGRVRNS